MCNFLQSQSSSEYQPFGITESRLDFRITDYIISIPNYYIIRRDPQLPGQTGIAVYVRQSVQAITHRRKDLENDKIECIWLELNRMHLRHCCLCVTCTETQRLPLSGTIPLCRC